MTSYIAYFLSSLLSKSSSCWKHQPNEYIRQLDLNEENMEVHNRSCIWTVSEMFFVESKVIINQEMVLSILYQLVSKFPVLRLQIRTSKEAMFFKEMGHVIPDLKTDESGNWISCFEEHSKIIFDSEKGPLWKCVFITNIEKSRLEDEHFKYQYGFLFVFHHAIMDGASVIIMLNEMQHLLNMRLKGKMSATENMAVSANMLSKPLQYYLASSKFSLKEKALDLCLFIPGLNSLICKAAAYCIGRSLKEENLYIKHIGVPANGDKCSSVKPIPFSKEETKRLLSACKKHGVTVQSALQTASVIALCNLLKNPLFSSEVDALPTTLTVDVGCTVNMKTILPAIPKANLGCYISMLLTHIQVADLIFGCWLMYVKHNCIKIKQL